jgi:hypothetical protein
MGTFFLYSVSHAVDLHLEVGVHSGGDDLRNTNTDQTGAGVKAGELMSVAIGAIFVPVDNFELQTTFGYKYDFDLPLDDVAFFERSEINLLLFYRMGDWRVGGGVTRHQGISLDATNFTDTTVDFEDATGAMLEFGYYYTKWGYVGFRYTNIDYKTMPAPNVNDVTVSGDSVGVIAGFRF